ncbi:unnamed protein product [Diplocarpon coronariae]
MLREPPEQPEHLAHVLLEDLELPVRRDPDPLWSPQAVTTDSMRSKTGGPSPRSSSSSSMCAMLPNAKVRQMHSWKTAMGESGARPTGRRAVMNLIAGPVRRRGKSLSAAASLFMADSMLREEEVSSHISRCWSEEEEEWEYNHHISPSPYPVHDPQPARKKSRVPSDRRK